MNDTTSAFAPPPFGSSASAESENHITQPGLAPNVQGAEGNGESIGDFLGMADHMPLSMPGEEPSTMTAEPIEKNSVQDAQKTPEQVVHEVQQPHEPRVEEAPTPSVRGESRIKKKGGKSKISSYLSPLRLALIGGLTIAGAGYGLFAMGIVSGNPDSDRMADFAAPGQLMTQPNAHESPSPMPGSAANPHQVQQLAGQNPSQGAVRAVQPPAAPMQPSSVYPQAAMPGTPAPAAASLRHVVPDDDFVLVESDEDLLALMANGQPAIERQQAIDDALSAGASSVTIRPPEQQAYPEAQTDQPDTKRSLVDESGAVDWDVAANDAFSKKIYGELGAINTRMNEILDTLKRHPGMEVSSEKLKQALARVKELEKDNESLGEQLKVVTAERDDLKGKYQYMRNIYAKRKAEIAALEKRLAIAEKRPILAGWEIVGVSQNLVAISAGPGTHRILRIGEDFDGVRVRGIDTQEGVIHTNVGDIQMPTRKQ